PGLASIIPRACERMLGSKRDNLPALAALLHSLTHGKNVDPSLARQCLAVLASKVETGEVAGPRLAELRDSMQPILHKLLDRQAQNPLYVDAAVLATALRDPAGMNLSQQWLLSADQPESVRVQALDALISGGHRGVLEAAARVLTD